MKELERVTNVPIPQMKRDWTEKWVPKILEQARFEATTSSAASTICAEMISLGKRPCTYHPLIGCMLVPVVMSYSLIGDMTAGCD